MSKKTVSVNASSLAGFAFLLEHVPVSLIVFSLVLWNTIRWCFRHWRTVGIVGLWCAAVIAWGPRLGTSATVFTAILCLVAWVALHAARGTARGSGAILVGLARLVKLRYQWTKICDLANLRHERLNLLPPMRDERITQFGLSIEVKTGTIGKHASIVQKLEQNLAATVGCDRIRVRTLKPSTAFVKFEWGQHLRKLFRLVDVPAPSSPQFLSFGVREDGGPAEILWGLSCLVGGATGSGKSSFFWAYIAKLIYQGIPFRARFVDPSGVEFAVIKPVIVRGGMFHQYADAQTKMEGKGGFWEQLESAFNQRLADIPDDVRFHVPTVEEPLDITFIDELLPFASAIRRDKEQHIIARINYMGRKAGFVIMAATQKGQVDTLGPVRDLFPQRICFRTPNYELTNAVLGNGAEQLGARCSELDVEFDRGVAYLMQYSESNELRGYISVRCAFVDNAETKVIAQGRYPEPTTARAEELENTPHVVYRYYNAKQELLYVGFTNDWARRNEEHKRSKHWYRDVAYSTTQEFPTRSLAATAEDIAINSENPIWNEDRRVPYKPPEYV